MSSCWTDSTSTYCTSTYFSFSTGYQSGGCNASSDAPVGAAYRFPCGFYVQLEVQGVGTYQLTENNTAAQDAFALLHARLGYERGRWGVHLFGRNLLNKEYTSNALDLRHAATPDLLIYPPGDPLNLGVALTARF